MHCIVVGHVASTHSFRLELFFSFSSSFTIAGLHPCDSSGSLAYSSISNVWYCAVLVDTLVMQKIKITLAVFCVLV